MRKKWTAEEKKAFGAKMKALRLAKRGGKEEDLDEWLAQRLVTPEKKNPFGNVYAPDKVRSVREDDGVPDIPRTAPVDVTEMPVSMPKNYESTLVGTKGK